MANLKPMSNSNFNKLAKRIRNEVKGSPKCPACNGAGFTLTEKFIGNDSYDEPMYMQVSDSCTECKETVTYTRVKAKYKVPIARH